MWLVVLRADYESENYVRVWAPAGELALSLCGVGSFGEVDIGEQRSSRPLSSCEFGALAGSGGAAGSVANVLGCAFAARLALGLQMPGAAATANSAPRRPFRELKVGHDELRASIITFPSSGAISFCRRRTIRHGCNDPPKLASGT